MIVTKKKLILLGVAIIVLGLLLLMGGKKSMVFSNNEKDSMAKYLKDKYKKDFDIQNVEIKKLGFAAGTLIESKCKSKDEEAIEFIIERRDSDELYKDGYTEALVSNRLKAEYKSYVSDLDTNGIFHITPVYNGSIEDVYNDNIDKSKLSIGLYISIPVESSYSNEPYVLKVHNLLKKLHGKNFEDLIMNITFYNRAYQDDIEKYIMYLNNDSTQREYREWDLTTLKNIYDKSTIQKFRYEGTTIGFEDNIEFTKKLNCPRQVDRVNNKKLSC